MKKIAVLSILVLAFSACSSQPPTPTEQPEITVETVQAGDSVTSPLSVKGKALGSWFFEGTLPVQMEDSQGNLIGMAPAHAQDDWHQEGYVRFDADLTFTSDTETEGTIIIKNDNPSGLHENEKVFKIPVKFKSQ